MVYTDESRREGGEVPRGSAGKLWHCARMLVPGSSGCTPGQGGGRVTAWVPLGGAGAS